MVEKRQLYKCEVCSSIVEVIKTKNSNLSCCSKNMQLLNENSILEGLEKHKPVISQDNSKVLIQVGSLAHPMTDKHYIEFIELITENKTFICYLKPEQEPKCVFNIGDERIVKARAYCNLHGLWKN